NNQTVGKLYFTTRRVWLTRRDEHDLLARFGRDRDTSKERREREFEFHVFGAFEQPAGRSSAHPRRREPAGEEQAHVVRELVFFGDGFWVRCEIRCEFSRVDDGD